MSTVSKFFLVSTLIICSVVYFSCSKNTVDTPPAITELISKLKSENPDCTCDPFLNEYLWKNKTVYVSGCGGPACDCFSIFYDSSARQLTLDSASYVGFADESTFIKNVWTCK